jgi:hypothetical protein
MCRVEKGRVKERKRKGKGRLGGMEKERKGGDLGPLSPF